MNGVNFYSTKRNTNVLIPRNKVCGYRIKNPIMKTGFSDGVKAGIDNGVVQQRLSRFSTKAERLEATSVCDGNANWLNYKRGESFNKPESANNQFRIQRPFTNVGGPYNGAEAQNIDGINKRGGRGNYLIERPNFLAPALKGRNTDNFENLQLLSVSEAGEIKSGFGQISHKPTIKIPDPTDFNWIAEREELVKSLTTSFERDNPTFSNLSIKSLVDRELEINKPLGRPQRTITKTTDDIASAKLNTSSKVNEIIQEVREGRVEDNASKIRVTHQLVTIFNSVNALGSLQENKLKELGAAISRIGIPLTASELGLKAKLIDIGYFNNNIGMINLLLINLVAKKSDNIPSDLYNYTKMVKNFATSDPVNGLPTKNLKDKDKGAVTLKQAVGFMARTKNRFYLSLSNNRVGLINRAELVAAAKSAPGNFDNALFSINPIDRNLT